MKKQFETKALICFFFGSLIIGALIHEAEYLTCDNLLGDAEIIHYESFVLMQEALVLSPWAVRHAVIMSGIVFLLLYAKNNKMA